MVEGPVYEPPETPLGDPIGLFRCYIVIKYRYNPLNYQDSEIMKKSEIVRKLFVMQADALELNKAIGELLEDLEKDQESEPTPLPETPS